MPPDLRRPPTDGRDEDLDAVLDAHRHATALVTSTDLADAGAQMEATSIRIAVSSPAHRILVAFLLLEQLAMHGSRADREPPTWVPAALAGIGTGNRHTVRKLLAAQFNRGVHPADVARTLAQLAAAVRPDRDLLRQDALAVEADIGSWAQQAFGIRHG